MSQRLYYTWSKEFLEAGKQRLTGNTTRQADSDKVKALQQENAQLKEKQKATEGHHDFH